MVAIRKYVASERNAMNPRDSGWPGAPGCATVGRMCPGSNWKFLAAAPSTREACDSEQMDEEREIEDLSAA